MTTALEIREGGGEIIPIEPADAKAWELVSTVLTWMSERACYNYSEAFRQLGTPEDPTVRKCPHCLSEIPIEASRCAFCTQEVEAAA